MLPESSVLIAVMSHARDLERARDEHWYRIPARSAPKFFPPDYVAFYFTKAFSPDAFTVRWYALVRGHERIVEGFRTVFDARNATLFTLFSSGGATNVDLPESSNYREVTPMALTIRYHQGVCRVSPFAIDYQRYNDPARNRLLAPA